MILPDGRALGDPSNAEIAAAAGAPTNFDARDYDVVIVGAGVIGTAMASLLIARKVSEPGRVAIIADRMPAAAADAEEPEDDTKA